MLKEVETQLEVLNQTASQINDLENQLLEARACFHAALSEQSDRLKTLGSKLGKCIGLARPYFEARLKQLDLHRQIQIATENFNRATDTLVTSRDALSRLEHMKGSTTESVDLDALESINRSISQVNSAMKNVADSKKEHAQLLQMYNESERVVRQMERKHKAAIQKSRPYFVHKQLFEQRMQEAKLRVDVCSVKVKLCKSMYAEAMVELEHISEDLHFKRCATSSTDSVSCAFLNGEDNPVPLPVRGEGVGAESPEFPECSISPISNKRSSDFFSTANEDSKNNDLSFSPENPRTSPELLQPKSPFPLMNGLLEQARQELDAFQSAVNRPIDINTSTLNPASSFSDVSPHSHFSIESPVGFFRSVTPCDQTLNSDVFQTDSKAISDLSCVH